MVPNELKHAFRMAARNPGYTLAAVAALALGIGANTAIFSIINTVLLKPLTYPDPDRIVQLMNTSPNGTYAWASIPNFSNWCDQTSILEDVAAFDQGGSAMNITGADPEQVRAAHVTADYFRLFGARFVYGRGFTPDDDQPHAGRSVVLSYALWQRRFAADPGIVGKTVDLSGEPYVIIGVTALDYRTDPVVDAWVSDVRWMVLMQGMRLVWIGAAIGLMGAFGLSRVLASFLFGVKALDPAVYATVPVLLSAVALFAVWFPARRATRIAPAEALRYE